MGGNEAQRVLIFGEVLFDCFSDGTSVLGGAPFNVAWHLKGFGLEPVLISRVGDDELGANIVEAMGQWGLDRQGLQTDGQRPTGVVEIELRGTEHTFSILPEQAYDYIDPNESLDVVRPEAGAILYHGTLAVRNAVSGAALSALLAHPELSVFLDINLRAPWWRGEDLPPLLQRARWLKLNDDELEQVGVALGFEEESFEGRARQIQERFDLEWVIITRGAAGAAVRQQDGSWQHVRPAAAPEEALVDTVGAGDAFSAVTLTGLVRGWPLATTLERAQAFASAICQVRGATVNDRGFYTQQLGRWRH